MTKQKKPKVGDTVGWSLVDVNGTLCGTYETRDSAREERDARHTDEWFDVFSPHRICRIVLSK